MRSAKLVIETDNADEKVQQLILERSLRDVIEKAIRDSIDERKRNLLNRLQENLEVSVVWV